MFVSFLGYEEEEEDTHSEQTHEVFSTWLTEWTIEIPLYFMVLMVISMLFSAYKLYLVLQEMLGYSEETDPEEDKSVDTEDSIAG